MKVFRKNISETRFGGAIAVYSYITRLGINSIIDNVLGQRVAQAYKHSEVITGFIMTIMTEGPRIIRAEDARKSLAAIKNLIIASHDTNGRRIKELSTSTVEFTPKNRKHPKRAKPYRKCENLKMCNLLIKTTKEVGLLKENVPNTLDIDATIIHSKTKEACYAYKEGLAYSPVGAFIGKSAVYIEMRSGNTSPQSEIAPIIDRTLKLLEENNITIDRIRMDGASYNAEIASFINGKGIHFVIGAQFSERTFQMLENNATWIEYPKIDYTSIQFNLSNDKNIYRLLVARVHENNYKHKDTTWDKKDKYYYKCVLTNDWSGGVPELIQEYNNRGGFERNFDYMKNDFGWRFLPFSRLNHNLTYMIICAMANNIFRGFLQFATKIEENLKEKIRFETFFRQFMAVTCLVFKNKYVFLNTDIAYEKLI